MCQKDVPLSGGVAVLLRARRSGAVASDVIPKNSST